MFLVFMTGEDEIVVIATDLAVKPFDCPQEDFIEHIISLGTATLSIFRWLNLPHLSPFDFAG